MIDARPVGFMTHSKVKSFAVLLGDICHDATQYAQSIVHFQTIQISSQLRPQEKRHCNEINTGGLLDKTTLKCWDYKFCHVTFWGIKPLSCLNSLNENKTISN